MKQNAIRKWARKHKNELQTLEMPSRFTKFVPCEIDMAPCFVRPNVSPCEIGQYGPDKAIDGKSELWRICIWGADDMGFENDVPSMDEALTIYNDITWVYGLPEGFRYA